MSDTGSNEPRTSAQWAEEAAKRNKGTSISDTSAKPKKKAAAKSSEPAPEQPTS